MKKLHTIVLSLGFMGCLAGQIKWVQVSDNGQFIMSGLICAGGIRYFLKK